MGRRNDLDLILRSVPGVVEVYYEPPEGEKLKYPCIMYELVDRDNKYADGIVYGTVIGYKVTVIDIDIDSPIPNALMEKYRCAWEARFDTAGLWHDVFNLYY